MYGCNGTVAMVTAKANAAGANLLNSHVPQWYPLPFLFGVSLLKLNNRKKGTFIINGLLGNLDSV